MPSTNPLIRYENILTAYVKEIATLRGLPERSRKRLGSLTQQLEAPIKHPTRSDRELKLASLQALERYADVWASRNEDIAGNFRAAARHYRSEVVQAGVPEDRKLRVV